MKHAAFSCDVETVSDESILKALRDHEVPGYYKRAGEIKNDPHLEPARLRLWASVLRREARRRGLR